MRTKLFKIVLFFLLPVALFSQTSDTAKATLPTTTKVNDTVKQVVIHKIKDTTRCHKFEIGFSFSPEYSYRKLKTDADNQSLKNTRDTMEVPKFGYSVGINLAYHINKNILIETGLLFSDKGENTKKLCFADVPQGQQPIYFTYKYHYYYLDIPVKANYYILTERFKVYVTAGISADIFLNQKTTLVEGHTKSDSQKTTYTANPGFNRFNFAWLAGAGINYKLNDKTNLKVEPIYTRSLTSVSNAPIKEYLFSAGLNIGIYHNF